MTERLRVTTSDGKYTVIQEESGGMRFLRHGEAWPAADQAFAHVGMILELAQDLEVARKVVAPTRVDEHHTHVHLQPGQSMRMVGDVFYVSADEPSVIRLTKAEAQSGLNRLRFAEGLILQLPADHDGRNTWLLNYGTGPEAAALRSKHGIKFEEATMAAETRS
jgi:hypothetical protein